MTRLEDRIEVPPYGTKSLDRFYQIYTVEVALYLVIVLSFNERRLRFENESFASNILDIRLQPNIGRKRVEQ